MEKPYGGILMDHQGHLPSHQGYDPGQELGHTKGHHHFQFQPEVLHHRNQYPNPHYDLGPAAALLRPDPRPKSAVAIYSRVVSSLPNMTVGDREEVSEVLCHGHFDLYF